MSQLQLGALLVVSPHLDDAVLGCGDLIAAHPGTVVLTLFAGLPMSPDRSTDWDAACGFSSAAEAVRARRAEDFAALRVLDAVPCWLDFPDDQYRDPGSALGPELLAEPLRAAIVRHQPETVMLPLGLFHRDHVLAHEAGLLLCSRDSGRRWIAYEDAAYRRIPGLLQRRLCTLAAAGVLATPRASDAGHRREAKRLAVHCYASQLRGLASPGRPGHLDAFAAEGYWSLTREPA